MAWERGASERVRGIACWGFCKACARARRGQRPLPWPGHGDGEVATNGLLWAVWHYRGAPARAKEGGGEAPRRRVGASAKQEGAGLTLHGVGGGALHSGGENRAKELEEEEKDPNIISEISRDQTVKQR